MFNWRKIPHPSYGNYGGAYNKCEGPSCPLPIDWMDEAFQEHDNDLGDKDPLADHELAIKLREGNPSELKGFYAKIYLKMCKLIFRRKRRKK